MNTEEKAKRFDEAYKVAKNIHRFSSDIAEIQRMEEIFPELKESEDEKIRKELIHYFTKGTEFLSFCSVSREQILAWLEKQGKKEQLYIRFGEIPTDEKSKIYQGEIEVGTENGVSVYPAFKTDEGDIVLGLSLPITRTTLYTQQHLIEYGDRSCYLVKGDYVGKDTDGQPLINNVSIIEKIEGYRVKEEKQGEQKPTDNVEPKFKVGDWIVNDVCLPIQIASVESDMYVFNDGSAISISFVDDNYHVFTIKNANDGDVLVHNGCTFIFMGVKNGIVQALEENLLDGTNPVCFGESDNDNDYHPAAKEQRDLLFQKMKEVGYEWDAEKKELKKIGRTLDMIQWRGNNLKEIIDFTGKDKNFDNWFKSFAEYEKYVSEHDNVFKLFNADGSHFEIPVGAWIVKTPDGYNVASKAIFKNKPVEWGEEDEMNLNQAIYVCHQNGYDGVEKWLKSFRPQKQWKPSEEQMKALENFVRSVGESGYASPYDNDTKLIYSLLNQIKQL